MKGNRQAQELLVVNLEEDSFHPETANVVDSRGARFELQIRFIIPLLKNP